MVHEGKKPHQCHLCSYKSARKPDLKKHITSVHYAKNENGFNDRKFEKFKEKSFQCYQCLSKFSERSQLIIHIEAIHNGIKPYHCEYCGYKSARKSDLKKHVIAVHERKKSPDKPKMKKVIAWPSYNAGKVRFRERQYILLSFLPF